MDASFDDAYSSTGASGFRQALELGERHELVVGAVDEQNGSFDAGHPRFGRNEQEIVDDLEREVTEHPRVGADEVLGGAQTTLGDGKEAADERHDHAAGTVTPLPTILLDRPHEVVPCSLAVDSGPELAIPTFAVAEASEG